MNRGPFESFSIPMPSSNRLSFQLGEPRGTLRTTTVRSGSAVVINAEGEIDAANEHTWHVLVSEAAAIAAQPGLLVVDVNGLEFMGCCAFRVLANEAERCRRRGVTLCVVSRDPGTARIVAACAFSSLLPVHPTTESALAAA
jgi:anti-anti-sigma factor